MPWDRRRYDTEKGAEFRFCTFFRGKTDPAVLSSEKAMKESAVSFIGKRSGGDYNGCRTGEGLKAGVRVQGIGMSGKSQNRTAETGTKMVREIRADGRRG